MQASWLQRQAKPSMTPSYNYVMGEESENFFETLHFGTVTVGEWEGVGEVPEWDTDFKTLVSKLDSYFFVKRNIIHERTKFQERKQSDSETTE